MRRSKTFMCQSSSSHHINILFIWAALVAHIFNPSTRKAEASGLLLVCLGFDFLFLFWFWFGLDWFWFLVLVSPGYPGILCRSSWPQIQKSLCLFLPGAWIKSMCYHIHLYFFYHYCFFNINLKGLKALAKGWKI